jgi:hypothetical protein
MIGIETIAAARQLALKLEQRRTAGGFRLRGATSALLSLAPEARAREEVNRFWRKASPPCRRSMIPPSSPARAPLAWRRALVAGAGTAFRS